MNIVSLSLASDFTPAPGGRLKRQGRNSAEEFYERLLAPRYEKAVERDAQLVVDLDGTAGVAASFLDEAFSRLARRFGAEDLKERLLLVTLEEPYLEEEIFRYIREAAPDRQLQCRTVSEPPPDAMTEVYEECSICDTVFRFPATYDQASRYYPPNMEPVQDIFPELPIPARAVLTRGNVCGLCLPQPVENVREILKPYIVEDEKTEKL